MANSNSNKKKFSQKLIHKYRMVVINEDTFEEKVSFKLSRLNVFIFSGIFVISSDQIRYSKLEVKAKKEKLQREIEFKKVLDEIQGVGATTGSLKETFIHFLGELNEKSEEVIKRNVLLEKEITDTLVSLSNNYNRINELKKRIKENNIESKILIKKRN